MKKLTSTLILLALLGCSHEVIVTDYNTNQFKLIKPATSQGVAIWQKVSPLDTNRWYTPTLDWLIHPTNTPSFINIAK